VAFKQSPRRGQADAAQSEVKALLENAGCMVRPVAEGTDVGIDLYCESRSADDRPFLHFWVQVKSGKQVGVLDDGRRARCRFRTEDLEYWSRQPVPVFAFLVPHSDNRSCHSRTVFVVNLTKVLLTTPLPEEKTKTLYSDLCIQCSNLEDTQRFLATDVSHTSALMHIKYGVVGMLPVLEDSYIRQAVNDLCAPYALAIEKQIRRTAAFSLPQIVRAADECSEEELKSELRRVQNNLAQALRPYAVERDRRHWETFTALALESWSREHFDESAEWFREAIRCIDDDKNLDKTGGEWKERKDELAMLKDRAADADDRRRTIEGKTFTYFYDYDELERQQVSNLSPSGKVKWFQRRVESLYLTPLRRLYDRSTADFFEYNLGTRARDRYGKFGVAVFSAMLSGIEGFGHLCGVPLRNENGMFVFGRKAFRKFIQEYMPEWNRNLTLASGRTLDLLDFLWIQCRCALSHGFRIEEGGIEVTLDRRFIAERDLVKISPVLFFEDLDQGLGQFFTDLGSDEDKKETFIERFEEIFPAPESSR